MNTLTCTAVGTNSNAVAQKPSPQKCKWTMRLEPGADDHALSFEKPRTSAEAERPQLRRVGIVRWREKSQDRPAWQPGWIGLELRKGGQLLASRLAELRFISTRGQNSTWRSRIE